MCLLLVFPLSLTLSPLVPRGERGLGRRESIWVARYFCLEMLSKSHFLRILSCAPRRTLIRTRALPDRRDQGSAGASPSRNRL